MTTLRAFITSGVVSTAAVSALLPGPVLSQPYPSKLVRIVVGVPPGGSLNLVARLAGQKLSNGLGKPVIIDNRPGAGGNIGTELAAKAPPDGYTLMVASSFFAINPSLYRKVSYDPIKDFEPVALLTTYMLFLVAHPSLPAQSVKALIALARARPGEINYASTGTGTTTHVAGELLSSMANARMTHIPYKGTNPQLPAVLGGEVALAFGTTAIVPLVQARKLNLLGVTGAKRSGLFPDVPTIAEAGVPGYEVTSWNALFAPAGTPASIVRRLNEEVRKGFAQADALDVFEKQGLEQAVGTPEELGALVRTEVTKWAKVIKDAEIPQQ